MSFVFAYDEKIGWIPGQSMRLRLQTDVPLEDRERWFSISSAPYERVLSFTMKMTPSYFKQMLQDLPMGGIVEGDHIGGVFLLQQSTRQVVFVAGGVGIAPFYAIIKQKVHDGEPIPFTLFYANASQHSAFSADLMIWQKDHPEFAVYTVHGRQLSMGYMQACYPGITASDIYICGPEPMVDAVSSALITGGVSADSLIREWYPGYGSI
jgi:ferredoxin-NADP reductase